LKFARQFYFHVYLLLVSFSALNEQALLVTFFTIRRWLTQTESSLIRSFLRLCWDARLVY